MKSEKHTIAVYASATVTAGTVVYVYEGAETAALGGIQAASSATAPASAPLCADDLSGVSYVCDDDLTGEIRRTIAELFMLLILSLWLNE